MEPLGICRTILSGHIGFRTKSAKAKPKPSDNNSAKHKAISTRDVTKVDMEIPMITITILNYTGLHTRHFEHFESDFSSFRIAAASPKPLSSIERPVDALQ